MSILESAQALDDVLAVVPQRARKGAMDCCVVGFLESMALHLGVGVCVDERGLRVGVPEPLGEQGQWHAGVVEMHRPGVPEHVRVDPGRGIWLWRWRRAGG